MSIEENVMQARDIIRDAEAILITAGAGMGVDSGLPDFRGNEGFWKAYPPMARLGISFVEMANPQWFDHNPALAWGFYGHRMNLYRKTHPHEGFALLLKLVALKKNNYFIFTSNVDGQFQKAGFDEAQIEECHGSIHHLQCVRPCSPHIWDASDITVLVDEQQFLAQPPLPQCPHCHGLARPNVLMFAYRTTGDTFPLVVIRRAAGRAAPGCHRVRSGYSRGHGALHLGKYHPDL